MINEVLEAKTYLEGKQIVQGNLYRICFILAKWFGEQGLSRLSIREEIFDWGRRYGVYIKYNVNDIIEKALRDRRRLRGDTPLRIGGTDVREITRRFDSRKTKLVALAVLCYAKAFADRDREFALSSVALGAWVGIHSSQLRRKYIGELIDFGYLSVVLPQKAYSWAGDKSFHGNRYRIEVPIENEGEFLLQNNEIEKLYREAFE